MLIRQWFLDRGGTTVGCVGVFLTAGAVALAASGCGSAQNVGAGSPRTLSTQEWCAEYNRAGTDAGFEWLERAEAGTLPEDPLADPKIKAQLERFNHLVATAPQAVRSDLQAMLNAVPELSKGTGTELPQPSPETLDSMSRAMQWLSEHCGTEDAEPPSPPDPGEFPQPTGDWAVAQSGTVGAGRWTLYRVEALPDDLCVSFEADPSYTDLQARIRSTLPEDFPPDVLADLPDAPPGPPELPEGFPPTEYKGKALSCGPKPDLFERSDPVLFWLHDEHKTNVYNVLAGLVMPGTASLEVKFDDGSVTTVVPVVDSFVVTYDPARRVKTVVPDVGDRANIVCAQVRGLEVDFPSLGCDGSYRRGTG